MRALRTRHLALVLSAAAVVAAGCGSSSKSKTTGPVSSAPATPATPSTPSATTTTAGTGTFTAQLKSVCDQFDAALKPTSDRGALLEQYLPRLKALKPPASQSATYSKFLASLAKTANDFKSTNSSQSEIKKDAVQNATLESELGVPGCRL